jgi:glycosyltransferase involved in cell wall biosynthesis
MQAVSDPEPWAANASAVAGERPLRVLCLDIEGGHGGSSRSLFEFVRHLDGSRAKVEVWCRQPGPLQTRYAALGVASRVCPDMPKVSSLPRLSRNFVAYARFAGDFARSRAFRQTLAHEVAARFDLVHFNHEGLFLLARWLRPRVARPLTMHIRTNPWDTAFARWQIRSIARNLDHLVYITENERQRHRALGAVGDGTVIYNVAEPPASVVEPHPAVPADGCFKVASLTNYSWLRGTDRLVAVAEALAARGRRDVLFVVAGDIGLPRSLPGELGKLARQGGSLADYATARGVADFFLFLGHVAEPEAVLAACDVLAKPTREDNPWGRDVIEALASGKPVLSVGRWNRFVETGMTGILQPRFDAAALADDLIRLAADRTTCEEMGRKAIERMRRLCGGRDRAADLAAVWETAVAHRLSCL